MATLRWVTVGYNDGVHPNYNTLDNALTTELARDLISSNEYTEIRISHLYAGQPGNFNQYATGAARDKNHYIKVCPEAGYEHRGVKHAGVYLVPDPSVNPGYWSSMVHCPFVFFEDIEWDFSAYTTSWWYRMGDFCNGHSGLAGAVHGFNRCFFHTFNVPAAGSFHNIILSISGYGATITTNCVFEMGDRHEYFDSFCIYVEKYASGGDAKNVVYNNSFHLNNLDYNAPVGFLVHNYGVEFWKNNIIYFNVLPGYSVFPYAGLAGFPNETNGSYPIGPPITAYNRAYSFLQPNPSGAGYSLNLIGSDVGAKDRGVDLSSDTDYPDCPALPLWNLGTDITHNARPIGSTWDVGAAEADISPRILIAPADLDIGAGESWYMNVAATGVLPLSYQWYKGAATMTGEIGPWLERSGSTESDEAYYSCLVTDNDSSAIHTSSGYLTVKTPPDFIVQPTGGTYAVGTPFAMDALALVDPDSPNHYQWYHGTGTLVGQTGLSYSKGSAEFSDAGAYQCKSWNGYAERWSATGTIEIIPAAPPIISVQPLDQWKDEGQAFHFACETSGLVYGRQWYHNGLEMFGETGLSISGVCEEEDYGHYYMVASGMGLAHSNAAQLRPIPKKLDGSLAIGIEFSDPVLGPGQYKRPKVYYADPADPAFEVQVEPEDMWFDPSAVGYVINDSPAGFPILVGVTPGTGTLTAEIRIDGAIYTVSGQVEVVADYNWGIDQSGVLNTIDPDVPFAAVEGGIKRPYQSMEFTETGFVTNELPITGPSRVEFLYPRVVGSQLFDVTDFERTPTFAYGFTWGSKYGGGT